jgi:hypothetical protein
LRWYDRWKFKAHVVTWGVTTLFVLEFGKFVVAETWRIIGPLFH